jgi:hypothetical protein
MGRCAACDRRREAVVKAEAVFLFRWEATVKACGVAVAMLSE